MRLINTIEFAPYSFKKDEYQSPDYDSSDDAWYLYWKESLSQSNILDLEPIAKRSWLVDLDVIQDKDLSIFIEKTFEEEDCEDIEMNIYGGIVIFDGDEIVLSTQCCGDLSNLQEWEQIFTSPANEWKMLWIGHPVVYYRYNGSNIEFSEQKEENQNTDNTYLKVHFSVSSQWLYEHILEIRNKQNIFIERVKNILKL